MTLEKATKFQNELRELFRKFGITSGCALVMHNEALHPVEAHVTERSELIVKLMDGMTEATKEASNIPVVEHWNTDEN